MSTRYRNQHLGIEVVVSRYAERLIGPKQVPEFVKLFMEMMDALGFKWAYVSKCGAHVSINLGA